mmetsp:Transcript_59648/g.106020  ORF Transcript_59648/g.106020 Transcript_59648/m.106020 type:complete len:228 (-) Transcript_59648:668-1351(-)
MEARAKAASMPGFTDTDTLEEAEELASSSQGSLNAVASNCPDGSEPSSNCVPSAAMLTAKLASFRFACFHANIRREPLVTHGSCSGSNLPQNVPKPWMGSVTSTACVQNSKFDVTVRRTGPCKSHVDVPGRCSLNSKTHSGCLVDAVPAMCTDRMLAVRRGTAGPRTVSKPSPDTTLLQSFDAIRRDRSTPLSARMYGGHTLGHSKASVGERNPLESCRVSFTTLQS